MFETLVSSSLLDQREREEGRGKRAKQEGEAAVTLRLVFLITSDPGRAEEEERSFLSDVSIMTRLRAVYTRTGRGRRGGWVCRASLGVSLGPIPAQGARGRNRKARDKLSLCDLIAPSTDPTIRLEWNGLRSVVHDRSIDRSIGPKSYAHPPSSASYASRFS